MGLIGADLELVSAEDVLLERKGYIGEAAVRRLAVKALVGSGAYMMCVNEHIRAQLDLMTVGTSEAEMADGSIRTVDVVGPLIVNFKNRTTSCNAMVLPGESEVLLGAIPMEDLDVVVLPRLQTIDVNPDSRYIPNPSLTPWALFGCG